MPLYEYECTKGHRFEKIEPYTAKTVQKCPKCGAKAERLLAAPAIQFKGSGWYVTDYAGKKSEGSSDSAPGTAGDGAGASGSGEKGTAKAGEKSPEKSAEKAAPSKGTDKGSEKRKK